MSRFDGIVSHFIDLLDSYIIRFCEKESSMSGEAEMTSDNFLKANFADGCTVFVNLCSTNMDCVLQSLFDRIYEIGSEYSSSTTRVEEMKFCAYCSLAKLCITSVSKEKSEKTLQNPLIEKFPELSVQIFMSSLTPSAHYICKSFASLFGVIGQYSGAIFDGCFEYLQTSTREGTETKHLQNYLRPFVFLSSGLNPLLCALEHISQFYLKAPESCKPMLADTISSMFRFAVMHAPEEFYQNFQSGSDLRIGTRLLSHIVKLDKKWKSNMKVAKMSCMLLLPDSVRYNAFEAEFEELASSIKGAKTIDANMVAVIYSLDTSFLMMSETQKFEVFGKSTELIMTEFIELIKRNFDKILESNTKLQKTCFVTFPLALFLYDADKFDAHMLPLLADTIKQTKGSLFCRFISKLCKHNNKTIFTQEIVKATINALKNLTDMDIKVQDLRFIFKAFTVNPKFFNAVMNEDPDSLTSIIAVSYNFNYSQLCTAISHFFDPSFFESNFLEENKTMDINKFRQILLLVSNITAAISALVMSSAMTQSTLFTESIPEMALRISQFVLVALQTDSGDEIAQFSELKAIINNIEVISLVLMISSSSDVCKTSISIISNLLLIINQAGLFKKVQIPLEAYQTLVTNCKGRSSCHAMDTYFVSSLKLIKEHSKGTLIAWETIYKYFISALAILGIEVPEKAGLTINKPVSVLQSELPNCFSMIIALLTPDKTSTIDFIHNFLKDDGFVGQMVVDYLPTALLPDFYTKLTVLIQKTVASMQGQAGVFDVNKTNSTYIKNSMKVMRNLLKQPFYDEDPVDASIITRLAIDFTAYCNLVSLDDCHDLCAHFIVAMMSHYSESIDSSARRTMANSLVMWLNKQVPNVILDALAQLLNNLEFDGEQSTDKFYFFVKHATTYLKEQANIKDQPNQLKLKDQPSIKEQSNLKNEIQKVLSSLFKKNIDIGIEHCISDCLSSSLLIRTTFLSAIASVLKNPEPFEEQKEVKDENLIDVLFETKFKLVGSLIDLVAFSRAEAVGVNLLEAAVTKGLHFEFMDFMIRVELKDAHEASKNAIFRGNGVASRAVGHFPRLFGKEWMRSNLKPMFEKFIKEIEGGKTCQINPDKLGPDENIVDNQNNFREMLLETINTVLSALETIPKAIIRVIQIIYHRINERFDDLGLNIVFGFVFLRFILPSFTVPAILGLPPLLPDKSRSCFLAMSVILMAAANRGNLNDKAKYYWAFNDIAADIQVKFREAILALIHKDLKDEKYEDVEIDTKSVISNLEKDFAPLRRQLETKIAELPEKDELRKSAIKLDKIIKKVKITSKPQGSPKQTEKASYVKLMANDFKGEDFNALRKWFFEQEQAANSPSIFYLNNKKLPHVNDLMVLAHHIFKTLKTPESEYFVIADMGSFDRSNIFKPSQIAKIIEMAPSSITEHLGKIIICNPCEAFVQYLVDCQGKFSMDKIVFAKTLDQITELIGVTPKLSLVCHESVTAPESIHTAKIDNRNVYFRMHERSLQMMQNCTQLPFEAFSLNVFFFHKIKNVTQSVEGSDLVFTFEVGNNVYKVQTSEGSTLFSLFSTAVERAHQKQSEGYKVAVEKASVQWLLLNIAFANLISNEQSIELNYAALQLVISIYATFDFNRNIAPIKCPEHLIPPNCAAIVSSLSQDLASSNFSATRTFLSEFFKMSKCLSEDSIGNTIPFLAPWVENLVKDKLPDVDESEDKMLNNVITFYFKNKQSLNVFNSVVWSRFSDSTLMERLFNCLKKIRSPATLRLVNFIGQLNPQYSSAYWVDEFSSVCWGEENKFAENVIHSLLMADTFDVDRVPDLLFKIVNIRDILIEKQDREEVGRLLNNLLAMLALQSKSEASSLIADAVKMYSDVSKLNFEEWVSQLCCLGKKIVSVLNILNLVEVRDAIFKKFEEKLKGKGSYSSFIGAIFCASLSVGNADELARTILELIHIKSEDNAHVVCYALSMLELSNDTKAVLSCVAIILVFTLRSRSALVLLNACLDENSIAILQKLPFIKEVEALTGAPLSSRPFFAIAMIVAAYDEKGDCKDIILKLKECDPVIRVIAVQYDESILDSVKDLTFGDDWPTVAAISFTTFMRYPELESTFLMVKEFINKNIEAFSCFNGFQELERRKMLRRISDNLKILEFGKIENKPKTRDLVNRIVAQIFCESKLIKVQAKEAYSLIEKCLKFE